MKLLNAVVEARSLLARREDVARPSGEADLPRALARRLYESVPSAAGAQVVAEYAEAAGAGFAQGSDLPEAMTRPGWATQISYLPGSSDADPGAGAGPSPTTVTASAASAYLPKVEGSSASEVGRLPKLSCPGERVNTRWQSRRASDRRD
jgi:hypothetical protein